MSSIPPRAPTAEEIARIAIECGLRLTDAELEDYRTLMATALTAFARLDDLAVPAITSAYPRSAGYRPCKDDNPYNAWYWRCRINGAPTGPLAGFEVGVKDAICVAGVPMMNGTRLLEGFVPHTDATVVTRLLDAGATIVGKTTTPEFTIAGGPHMSARGPVLNPRRPTHSPGASSGGSAAAIAAGDVRMALGGDQAGSIRYPASWCGVAGLKPTYGLVPYTGCIPLEMSLDHVGPMADTAANVALMLSAIAGPDGLDPRQRGVPEGLSYDYGAAIGQGVKGLRVGLLKEGFGHSQWEDLGLPASEEVVDRQVEAQVRALEKAGAIVSEVSVPLHFDGVRICVAIFVEGLVRLMLDGDGIGHGGVGHCDVAPVATLAMNIRSRPNELPANAKYVWMLGEYLKREYRGTYYAKAQNMRPILRRAYDEALKDHDVLIMPATPTRAVPLAPPDHDLFEAVRLRGLSNQCQFNVTGHPALSVPCGAADGLPIGAQIVGRHFEELTVLSVGDALEKG